MACGCKQGVLREIASFAFAVPVPGTAGASNRFTYQLPPADDVEQYSVIVKNRDTVAPAAAVNLFFSFQPTANQVAGLAAGAGMYLKPGDSYRGILPGDSRQVMIDFAGLLQTFITPTACVAQITIKACGGGKKIPTPGAGPKQPGDC